MCIVSSCQVTGSTYYGIIAVLESPGDKLELITLPLGPKHNARSTCSVNSEYASALWLRCTEDVLRGVVRSINPDKFNMTTGIDASGSTGGRKRKSAQELCKPTPEEALIVSLQSDMEALRKDNKKLRKQLERRDSTIVANTSTIEEKKTEIKKLKSELKSAKNAKKPKSIPSKCTQCTKRAREEATPENNKTSRGGQVTTLQQQSQQSDQDIERVLVSERDKNDKLVMDLTSQMTNTLQRVVADVVQKSW